MYYIIVEKLAIYILSSIINYLSSSTIIYNN